MKLSELLERLEISIHSPLAGRDGMTVRGLEEYYNFNPLAPRGARQPTGGVSVRTT